MSKLGKTRRDFLKKMLTASILTATCPHVVLGKITPKIEKKDDKIQGVYRVRFEDYPELREEYGTVRIKIEPTIGGYYFDKIMVTRLPKSEFGKEFSCLSEKCPHEGKLQKPLHPALHIFECTGHGSKFRADGTFLEGPAAEDLTKYEWIYEGNDEIFVFLSPYPYDDRVSVVDESSTLFYLKQNYPNPCTDITTIEYGVEKPGLVDISIYDLTGNKIQNLLSGLVSEGFHELRPDLSNLAPGNYFYRMNVNNDKQISRKLVKK